VIDNLKGKLKKNTPLPIFKEGGIAMDQASVYLYEDDELPRTGSYYIFLGFAQPDGSIIVSGPNSNILIDASNQQEIVSSPQYQRYTQAVRNEIPFDRVRSVSKYAEQ
jgi:hypothetical protein